MPPLSTVHLIEPVRLLDEEQQPLERPAGQKRRMSALGLLAMRTCRWRCWREQCPSRQNRTVELANCAVRWVRPARELLRGTVEDEPRAQVIQQLPIRQRHRGCKRLQVHYYKCTVATEKSHALVHGAGQLDSGLAPCIASTCNRDLAVPGQPIQVFAYFNANCRLHESVITLPPLLLCHVPLDVIPKLASPLQLHQSSALQELLFRFERWVDMSVVARTTSYRS